MTETFFKFPSTPHLKKYDNIDIRSNKILSSDKLTAFLKNEIVVEEKVDGSNLGISFDSDGDIKIQNRGSYLTLSKMKQWNNLDMWIDKNINYFFEVLLDRYILFGEWCYAQHTIKYNNLPDWFIGFDIYDKQQNIFLSTKLRNDMLNRMNIHIIPCIDKGMYNLYKLEKLLLHTQSYFSDELVEGLYLRHEDDDKLINRVKLVNPTFIQSIDLHWSKTNLKCNKVVYK